MQHVQLDRNETAVAGNVTLQDIRYAEMALNAFLDGLKRRNVTHKEEIWKRLARAHQRFKALRIASEKATTKIEMERLDTAEDE